MTKPREATRHREELIPSLTELPVQNTFTGLFIACFYNIKAGLQEGGLRLTNNEAFVLILLKEYLAAGEKMKITKQEAYGNVIHLYLDISFMTFNRVFNSLVRKHCFNPLGVRGNGKIGLAEEYAITMVAKRIDAIQKMSTQD